MPDRRAVLAPRAHSIGMAPVVAAIASRCPQAYLTTMAPLRLIRWLTLFSLLLAPLGMMSAHATMPVLAGTAATEHHGSAAADHCGGMDGSDKQQPASGIDCTIACSACPSGESETAVYPVAAAPTPLAGLAETLHGLHPESEPPPPRFA